MPKTKRHKDNDWTPDIRCSKKKKPPSQPSKQNCILHGSKGTVIDNFVALSSLSDPLSVFADIRDMKWKLLTLTSDYGGLQDVCKSIPDVLSPVCGGYHENCRRLFLSSKCIVENPSRPTRECVNSTVLFGKNCIFCKGDKIKKATGKRYRHFSQKH